MQGLVYFWLKKMFSQEKRNQLKKQMQKWRSRTNGLKKILFRPYSAEALIEHIESQIGHDFDILMVHASYQDMLPMFQDSPAKLVEVLIQFCQEYDITLAMPAFFFGRNTDNHIEFYQKYPKFDNLRTPSQMGLISEMFRRTESVLRSLHPSHSVCALGPLADQVVRTHHTCGTTFGEGSPFGVMAKYNTKIIGLGVKYFRCLTQVHTAEDILKEHSPLQAEVLTIPVEMMTDQDESKNIEYHYRTFPGKVRDATVLRKLLKREELVEWSFHGTPLFHTMAKRVTDALCQAAQNSRTIYR